METRVTCDRMQFHGPLTAWIFIIINFFNVKYYIHILVDILNNQNYAKEKEKFSFFEDSYDEIY